MRIEDEWRSMLRRFAEHLRGERTSDLGAATMTIAASAYTDPARFELERTRLFREQPLLVGFSRDLPAAGDRMCFDEAGVPVVVARAEDGGVRAFLNLCPHRGTRLVETCERSRRLTCPLHGWSFDLAGRLVGMAQPAAFDGLDRARHGLVALPAAEWAGMIFVRATPGPAIDVPGFLGTMAPLLEALDLGRLERVRLDRMPVATNWKAALDTFAEAYHVPVLHAESLATNLVPFVMLFDHYGRHHRYSGPGLELADRLARPEAEWPTGGYQAVHYLFPNTTIAFTHAFDGATPVASMFRLFPGASVGEAVSLGSTYRRAGEGDVPDEQISHMHDVVCAIVRDEDYRVANASWPSLAAAPPGLRLVLGRSEPLLQRYHRDIADAIGLPLPE